LRRLRLRLRLRRTLAMLRYLRKCLALVSARVSRAPQPPVRRALCSRWAVPGRVCAWHSPAIRWNPATPVCRSAISDTPARAARDSQPIPWLTPFASPSLATTGTLWRFTSFWSVAITPWITDKSGTTSKRTPSSPHFRPPPSPARLELTPPAICAAKETRPVQDRIASVPPFRNARASLPAPEAAR